MSQYIPPLCLNVLPSVFSYTIIRIPAALVLMRVTIQGVSSDWWNYRHNNHHSKPNTINKDPDIKLDYLFLLGKVLPVEVSNQRFGKVLFSPRLHILL